MSSPDGERAGVGEREADESSGVFDSSEEEATEEETEEDRRFVVQDDAEEGGGHASEADSAEGQQAAADLIRHRRKRVAEEEELDEEDLDLIEENLGVKLARPERSQLKRLKKGKRGGVEEEARGRRPDEDRDVFEDAEPEEKEDDMHDFVVEDEADELGLEHPEPRERHTEPASAALAARQRAELPSALRAGALSDVFEIFGDGQDYAHALVAADEEQLADEDEPEEQQAAAPQRVNIEEAFEPSILIEKYFTEADEKIRVADVPERMQLRDGSRPPPADGEIEQEALWMAQFLPKKFESAQYKDELVEATAAVLRCMREEFLEVPFVALHRKEYYDGVIEARDLWTIHDKDAVWKSLYERKNKLRTVYGGLRTQLRVPMDEHFETLLRSVDVRDELDDLHDYLKLHYASDLASLGRAAAAAHAHKQPVVKSFYAVCKKIGLDQLVSQFGISAREFGMNLMDNFKRFQPVDPERPPEELAQGHVQPGFAGPDLILTAARKMAACALATEPNVRKTLRLLYETRAEITTRPTEKGRKEIDEHHCFAHIKYLSNKPASSFQDGQFLEIARAEREGFLRATFRLGLEDELRDEMRRFYYSDATSVLAERWNEQRGLIVEEALNQHLFPLLERSLRDRLAGEAADYIARVASINLERKLNVGPFTPTYVTERDHQREDFTVMAVGWAATDLSSATMAVVLSNKGDVVDFLRLKSMRARVGPHAPVSERLRKEEDVSALKDFIEARQPAVIVVSPGDLACRRLHEDISRCVHDLRESNRLERAMHVTYMDDDVARVYQHSEAAATEFPDYPPLLRYCISLGRRVLDPLAAFAALCNEQHEILCIKSHLLQDLVPQDDLLHALCRAFINVVNVVGVDMNEAANRRAVGNMVQFVSGFGARKADALLRNISRKGGFVESRQDFILKNLMGARVYMNCAAFFRIRAESFVARKRGLVLDALDDTRIHPEDYQLARKMAADALEVEETVGEEENPSQHVEEVLGDKPRLMVLLLEEFAKELQHRHGIRKRITLEEIRQELMAPYRELREPYRDPTPEEIFTLLTRETDLTLRPGLIVPVTVTRVTDRQVSCRLDNGLHGSIATREMSDDPSARAEDLFRPDQAISCRVLRVNKEKFAVDLACRPSELDEFDRKWDRFGYKDDFYDFEADRAAREEERASVLKKKTGFTSRAIAHPLFKNITFQMAEAMLERRDPGDAVIRPSSKGMHHLTITWKVDDRIYQHIDILEGDKENDWSLGRSLSIGNERFEDLDEIIARFVEPMAMFVRELSRYKKFQRVHKNQIVEMLRMEKSHNPGRIPYFLSFLEERPGTVLLSYQPGSRPRHEHIAITPEGYKFRQRIFGSADDCITWFKQHYLEPLPAPESTALQRPMTPQPAGGYW